MTKQSIIDTIKQQRKDLGLSQNDLAIKAKTYKAEISLLEAAKKTVTIDTLLNICNALNITVQFTANKP